MIANHDVRIKPKYSFSYESSDDAHSRVFAEAMEILKETSRTFFIPISRLPDGLMITVASAYLCMRAIDEIEDHPVLECQIKEELLRNISRNLQSADGELPCGELFVSRSNRIDNLPEVTVRLCEWAQLAPIDIAPRIWDAIAAMADRMADWVASNWDIQTQADLDRYTFSVAGAVGLILSDLWMWYDGTRTNRQLAVGFGRGLQSVNILRNRNDDLSRGVDFFPSGWNEGDMFTYSRYNLGFADEYVKSLPSGAIKEFCSIPLVLAHATLNAMEDGKNKLSREEVHHLVESVTKG